MQRAVIDSFSPSDPTAFQGAQARLDAVAVHLGLLIGRELAKPEINMAQVTAANQMVKELRDGQARLTRKMTQQQMDAIVGEAQSAARQIWRAVEPEIEEPEKSDTTDTAVSSSTHGQLQIEAATEEQVE